MSQITQQLNRIQLGALQIAIAMCTLATAFIHLYTGIQPDQDLGFWLVLNGLGSLALLTAFFLPRFASWHDRISFLLMGYALLTIVLWLIFGLSYDLVGYTANAIEIVLAALALYEGWRTRHLRSRLL